jgi:DNA-damage-inducible protein J
VASTSITIRIDKDLKQQAEALFEDMGLNMTTAFTIFAKTVVRKKKIPFEIEADPFYSEANQKFLLKAIRDAEAGKLTPHELTEA